MQSTPGPSDSRLSRGVAAALAVAAVALAPVAAEADINEGTSGGLTYMGDSDLATGATTLAAACPAGRHVTGGGASAPTGGNAHINAMRPFDGADGNGTRDDGFIAFLWNGGAIDFSFVNAVCGRGKLKYRSASRNIPPGEARQKQVRCPGDRHVTGGGVFVTGPISSAHLNSSHPIDGGDRNSRPDDGWRGRAFNASDAQRMTVYAICRLRKLAYRSSAADLAVGPPTALEPSCPTGMHVTGGGLRMRGPAATGVMRTTEPADQASGLPNGDADSVPDDLWRGAAQNISGPDKPFTAYAICK